MQQSQTWMEMSEREREEDREALRRSIADGRAELEGPEGIAREVDFAGVSFLEACLRDDRVELARAFIYLMCADMAGNSDVMLGGLKAVQSIVDDHDELTRDPQRN